MVTPWLRHDQTPARVLMVGIALLLLARYFVWRVTQTLPETGWSIDFAAGIIFLLAESASLLAAVLASIFLCRTRNRSQEVEDNKAWLAGLEPPLVDVLICTYNEEEAILERTIIGATGMNHGNYRVWVLDDGRRPWLEDLSRRLGCRYLARPDNAHAKAGNINHALTHLAALLRPPQFVSILDADFVPLPDFLSRALCLFRESSVGLVQTPQHFINPDPIQTNLAAGHVWPDEQRFFFDVVLASKDAWGAAFCCGTSSVIRFAPLLAVGGFPTDSVTEDYLLTLRLKETGFTTSYLNEKLTLGLAPEGLKEYITQRGRWCLGFMQITRGRSGPFSRSSNLSFIDRLSLVDTFLNWTAVYIAKALGLFVPIGYLLFGVHAVRADLLDLLGYFLPFFLWHSLTMSWISRGRSLIFMTDVSQFIATPAILKAIFTGLLRPQGQKFKVTAKGGDRGRRFVEWPLVKIYGSLIALTLAGLIYAFAIHVRGDSLTSGGLAFAWSWYNLIILTIVCFVCIEQPRRRKAERFETDEAILVDINGRTLMMRLVDISITGARLKGDIPAPLGTVLTCTIRGGIVEATIVRDLSDSFAIKFDEALGSRVDMIRGFYAGNYVNAFEQVQASGVTTAIVRRLFD
ncbi:glycosyltransferase [Bosea sp. PAMC 26642]|uniref:glycosyltransferase n=1 Tax=Bosea sp. (strain PAMC 26642) TaxID=1792307 RepID=UPI000770476A|nr:glycosyltransferase [Bosea sp. PAMC 26642]AMJ63875.1 glycosyl transferase family 2 [Bosea sp. PAMC 26642]